MASFSKYMNEKIHTPDQGKQGTVTQSLSDKHTILSSILGEK